METILVTGASRRLGGIIAKDLAAAGHFVWIHYRSHEDDAYALRENIIASGGQCECLCADLTDTDQIDEMLGTIRKSDRGALTTLINNASLFTAGTLGDTSPDDWDRTMNTNLKAVWYLSSQFAETFPSARRVITIGDAGVSKGYAGHAVYGLSKYALKYLTIQMADAYAPNVQVNLLSPGLVLKGENETDKNWNRRTEQLPLDNRDIVDSVLKGIHYLMSDPGLIGTELLIDNGFHLSGNAKI